MIIENFFGKIKEKNLSYEKMTKSFGTALIIRLFIKPFEMIFKHIECTE